MNTLWISELVMVLLIPLLTLGFGLHFYKKGAPREINQFFGYRTTRSTRSWETWAFAHKTLGKLWRIAGLIMLVVSAGLFAIVIKQGADTVSVFGILLMFAQMIVLAVTIILVEKALKNNFDDRGERTEASLAAEQQKQEQQAQKSAKKEKAKK